MPTRRFHTDSRTRENFTENGLTSLTGQPSQNWGRYVVKELVDNALEAVEGTESPVVTVRLRRVGRGSRSWIRRVEVEDNGPGIDGDTLRQIADVEAFGGTKRHYALPTRGTQGNALMTVIGIQSLADGGPLQIETRGTEYALPVDESVVDAVPAVRVEKRGPSDTEGTAVRVEFGESGTRWARGDSIYRTLYGFSALNPHVQFEVVTVGPGEDPRVTIGSGSCGDSATRYAQKSGATTGRALWFSDSSFSERLKADLRAAPDLSLEQFVSEFDGLSSRKKRRAVLEKVDVDRSAPIGDVFGGQNGRFRGGAARDLLQAMKAETTARAESGLPSTLGSVGAALKRGARRLLEHREERPISDLVERLQSDGFGGDSWEDLALYYRGSGAKETGGKRVPFVFEVAAIPFLGGSLLNGTQHRFGINQSVAYSAPNAAVEISHAGGASDTSHRSTAAAFGDAAHPFAVVSNLTCPNLSFQDKGKQSFATGPFENVISEVVGKTLRKYERELRPALNEATRDDRPEPTLQNKAPKGFIKDAVFDLFGAVYEEATEGGRFSITMRQLFYKMRPAFQRYAKRAGYKWKCSATPTDRKELALNYDTFTGYVGEYEQDVLGKRVVHRDERGFFVEPHSERRVELSTKKVRQYDPAAAVSEECGTLLYVEKKGFYEQIHVDFEITKRYDVGLICAEGYNTGAGRDLVEKIRRENPGVRLLLLTDLDVGGLGIATDADRPDALSERETFGAERIGVTPEDVERYGLHVETPGLSDRDRSRLHTFHEAGHVPDPAFDFLSSGKRVEINAFSPTDLKGYLEDKLQAAGVEKIRPDAEEVETPDVDGWEKTRNGAIREAIGRYVQKQIGGDLIDRLIQECGDAADVPPESERPTADASAEEIRDRILEKLDERPPQAWTEINRDVVESVTEETTAAQDELRDTVQKAVLEQLSASDLVDVGSS
jgi:hypothetical protein